MNEKAEKRYVAKKVNVSLSSNYRPIIILLCTLLLFEKYIIVTYLFSLYKQFFSSL